VAHAYGPNYLRDGDQEGRNSRPDWAKKVFSKKKKLLDMVALACHPSNGGKHKIGGQ
jgi:hypothetical protein